MRDLVTNITTGIIVIGFLVIGGLLLAGIMGMAEEISPGSTSKRMPFWLGIPVILSILYGLGKWVNSIAY